MPPPRPPRPHRLAPAAKVMVAHTVLSMSHHLWFSVGSFGATDAAMPLEGSGALSPKHVYRECHQEAKAEPKLTWTAGCRKDPLDGPMNWPMNVLSDGEPWILG